MGTSIETLFQANWKNDMLVQVTSAFYKNILDNVPNGLKIITSRSRTCQSRNYCLISKYPSCNLEIPNSLSESIEILQSICSISLNNVPTRIVSPFLKKLGT